MTDLKAAGLGTLGILGTFVLEHYNAAIAAVSGTIVLALLLRKAVFAFRADFRGVLVRMTGRKDPTDKGPGTQQEPPQRPE